MGARIINRRLVNAREDHSVSDLVDAWIAGVKRGEDLYRTTGVSPSAIASQSADEAFGTWWEYGGAESPLPRSIARAEWLRGFRKGRRRNPSELVSVQEKIDALVERINLTGGTASQLLRLQDLKKRRDALEGLEEVDIPESHYRTAEEIERESRRKGSYRGTYNPAASEMSAADINRRLDRLDTESSKLTRQFIEAGRGNERMSEIAQQTDPLSAKWNQVQDEYSALRREVERRYGPGAPSRLPRGFGPIRARF